LHHHLLRSGSLRPLNHLLRSGTLRPLNHLLRSRALRPLDHLLRVRTLLPLNHLLQVRALRLLSLRIMSLGLGLPPLQRLRRVLALHRSGVAMPAMALPNRGLRWSGRARRGLHLRSLAVVLMTVALQALDRLTLALRRRSRLARADLRRRLGSLVLGLMALTLWLSALAVGRRALPRADARLGQGVRTLERLLSRRTRAL